MKKLLLVISILTLSFTSQAISLDTLAHNAMATVDSAKQTVVNTANTVDTSRLSKQVYADFKQALAGIASALKVGVEHVYIVLVRQQFVKAIQWTILGLLPLIVFIVFGRSFWRYCQTHDKQAGGDDFCWFLWCFFCLICIIGGCFGIAHIDTIVTGFVNPEYGAMTDIMDFIERIKH
jgi:uncharacterized membrane protein SirB2